MTTVDRGAGAANLPKRDAKAHERNLTRLQARLQVERARADFAGTLNALEDKLNVPKQVGRATDRARVRLRRFANEQPVAAAAAAVGVVLVAGGIVWLVVRNATKS
ncbi:DUF3618 domain-containing protein [Agromyces intestinalis]|uniref:DUF3618 domain-containing protein n=1 Tax=Agromyces intestinalis TaxID=2592652 RepID=A0A5C1YFP9_9MICO|nr:DUF3618 domain-containing protein [Agromyces intestinalis]QEO14335.1 DUF3618 domain-containing protein [Agromyces intestinalis]